MKQTKQLIQTLKRPNILILFGQLLIIYLFKLKLIQIIVLILVVSLSMRLWNWKKTGKFDLRSFLIGLASMFIYIGVIYAASLLFGNLLIWGLIVSCLSASYAMIRNRKLLITSIKDIKGQTEEVLFGKQLKDFKKGENPKLRKMRLK